MYPHKSLMESASATYEINKSTFICNLMPVKNVEEAQNFINSIKKTYFDARHNCSAYIIGKDQHLQKANDDGEPSGTAGIPILEVLKKQNLTNIAAVVTRYFGGIKLGAGGLIRAYGKATTLALDAALIVNYQLQQCYSLTLDYNLIGIIENYLQQKEIPISSKDFSHIVTLKIALPLGTTTPLTDLSNLSAGKIIITELEQELIPIPVK